jgi:hypothetical protein
MKGRFKVIRKYGLIAVVVAFLALVAAVPFTVETPRIVRTDAWAVDPAVGDTLVGGAGLSHAGAATGVCKTYPLTKAGINIRNAKAIRLIVTWTTWTAGDFYLAPVYASTARDTGVTNYFDTGVYVSGGWLNNFVTPGLTKWILCPFPTRNTGATGKLVIDLANVPSQGYLFVRVLTRSSDLTFDATGVKIRAEVMK